MQFGLLENGVDSLKVTGDILLEYYQDHEFQGYQIKDALFSFVHGVEVLAKSIIKAEDESKIFTKKSKYESAKIKMIELSKENVFEVNPELRTISVTDAIKILEDEYHLSADLYNQNKEFIDFRNQLMHYTVDLDEDDFLLFVNNLRVCFHEMVEFFNSHISEFKDVFDSAVRELGLTEYEMYLDELEIRAGMAHEEARLEAKADFYDSLEEYHKH